MGTHDEETRKFFEGTQVVCRLCTRDAGTEYSLAQRQQHGRIFTHHQKTVRILFWPCSSSLQVPQSNGLPMSSKILSDKLS